MAVATADDQIALWVERPRISTEKGCIDNSRGLTATEKPGHCRSKAGFASARKGGSLTQSARICGVSIARSERPGGGRLLRCEQELLAPWEIRRTDVGGRTHRGSMTSSTHLAN